MSDTVELPPHDLERGTKLLPYEERYFHTKGMAERLGYTDDLRRYYSEKAITAAVLAERERCAMICEGLAHSYGDFSDVHPAAASMNCAAAIRSGEALRAAGKGIQR